MRAMMAAAVLLAGLLGCALALPEPTAQMAGGDEAVLSDLRTGRDLYVRKCSGCHALVAPEAHSDRTWASEVEEMMEQRRVKLSGEDRRRLLLYLTAANGRD